jgi:hypothetical protein
MKRCDLGFARSSSGLGSPIGAIRASGNSVNALGVRAGRRPLDTKSNAAMVLKTASRLCNESPTARSRRHDRFRLGIAGGVASPAGFSDDSATSARLT